MECRQEKTRASCTCTYNNCAKKGLCCECIAYHRERGEAPGCLFPPEVEKTYNRSLERLARCYQR